MTRLHEDLVLGLDLGTSSLKGVAVDVGGALVAEARAEYPMRHPRLGWNQNDATDWVSALVAVVGKLAASVPAGAGRIRALCLVGQRDPFVLLDADGVPTMPAISWTDRRTGLELTRVQKLIGHEELIDITGGRPVVGGGVLNLMWAREHAPRAWDRTVRVASPKDYLLGLIGAERGTEPTTPTRSLAFDVRHLAWSRSILDLVDLDESLFDPVLWRAWESVGTLDPRWAEILGLPTGVILAAGSADDHAAALGSGAVRAGQRSLGTGTCSSWRELTTSYQPDATGRVDCSPYVAPGLFMREATIDSLGSSLRWFRDTICSELPTESAYDTILAMAATVPAGAGGVVCFPFVDGAQRAPFFQSGATGAFLGITAQHTRAHLARAVIESVALLYAPTLELMGGDPRAELTIVDGEAASSFWNQVKADVLGCPVRTPRVLDAGAMGAAVLASVAAGVHRDLEAAVSQMVRWNPVQQPDPLRHEQYQEQLGDYLATFEALRPVYAGQA